MAKRNPSKYFKDIKDAVILITHFRHVRSHVTLLPMVCLFARDLAFSKRHLTNKIKESANEETDALSMSDPSGDGLCLSKN